jgi:hypothetical protein
MHHFAYTTQESTIVLFGMGPVDFAYVNPADDPRNTKKVSNFNGSPSPVREGDPFCIAGLAFLDSVGRHQPVTAKPLLQ